MRNLKKVLSLTLALVMMLGMMTFAGAAEITSKDLTDMNDVKNKEAVTLLVDLKIVAGRDTGKFDPMGTLTRAEFAKMIYVAKMGVDDKAANFVGATTGLTDTKMWAEGYINYCYSTGIVAGRGAGKFDPDGKVQTVEAAKMLLVALGFDSEAQGYINDSLWSVNVMQDAKKAGLMAGVKDAANVPLTRDSAAQMIYNALFAKTVTNERQKDFTGKWYVSKTTENATTLGLESFNLVKVTGQVAAASSTTTTISGITGAGNATLNRAYEIAVPGSLGKTITLYAKFDYTVSGSTVTYGAFKSLVSMQAGVATANILGKNVDGTAFAKLVDADKSAYISTLDAGVKYYYNGAELKTYANLTDAWAGLSSAAGNAIVAGEPVYVTSGSASTTLLGNGVVVSFIDNDSTGKADVVDIVSYTANKVATYSNKDKGSVTFNPSIAGTWTAKNVIGFDTIAKDDVIVATEANGKLTVMKTTAVEGSVTSKNTSKGTVTVAGTAYEFAMHNTGASIAIGDASFDLGNDITLYLDANNYIVGAKAGANTTNESYLFITANDATTMAGTQAKAYFSDGTSSVINVKEVAGVKTFTADHASVKGAHTFTLKDGKYTLSANTVATTLATATSYTAKKGSPVIVHSGGTDTSTFYANSKTLFVDVANGKVYTGYANLPGTMTFTDGAMVVDSKLMKIVYMTTGITASTGSTDEIIIASTGADVAKVDGNLQYTITAVVNGVKNEKLVLDATAYAYITDSTTGGARVYKIDSTDTNGVVTGLTQTSAKDFTAKKDVAAFTENTLVVTGDKAYVVNDDTIYVEVNTTDETLAVVASGNIVTAPTASKVIVTPVGTTVGSVEAATAKIVYIIK